MNHIGNPTPPETIAYFECKLAKLKKENIVISNENRKLKQVLDDLCAHAEPVCDCLEIGQTLKSPDTLKNFREYLSRGWEAI